MADQADGVIRIETALDTSGFIADANKLNAAAQRSAQAVSRIGMAAEKSVQSQFQAFAGVGQQLDQQTEDVKKLNNELDKLGNKKTEIKITRSGSTDVSDYDGPLYQGTTVDAKSMGYSQEAMEYIENYTSGAKDQVNELRQAIEQLKAEMKSMEKDGKWWGDDEYDKAALKLEQMQQAAKDYKKELFSPEPNANPFGLDTLAGQVREAELEINKLIAAGKGLGNEDYDRAYVKLQNLKTAAREYQKELTTGENKTSLSQRLETVGQKFGSIVKHVGSATASFRKLKSHALAFASAAKKAGSAVASMAGFGKKSESSMNGLSKALKTVMRYGLGIRSVYALIGKFRSAAVAGFNNLARYSSSVNASLSSVMSSLTRLKNSLATAFAPILTVVAPILSSFVDMCSRAATQVGMFFAAMTGKTTFTQAKAVQQDYAASLSSSTAEAKKQKQAAEAQAKALKKAQKAAEGDIAAFDELNLIHKDSTDTSDTTGTDIANSLSPKDMFEEVPIKSKIKDFADKIKALIKKQDWKGIGKLLGDQINRGLQKVYDAINWKKVGPKVTKFCNAFTEAFNSLVDSINWTLLGQTIGAGVNTLAKTFNLLFGPNGIDFNNLGRKLSTGLRGLMDEVDWRELGNAFGNKFMILWRTLGGFVDDMTTKNSVGQTGWQQLGISVANTLNGIFDQVSFKDLAHTAATGINGIFSALNEAVDKFSWKDFTENLKAGISTFLSETTWKENGQALGNFIKHLCDTINSVMTMDNFIQFGENIGIFLSQLPWGTILVTVASAIVNSLGGILAGLAKTPAGVFADAFIIALLSAKIIGAISTAFKTLFTTAASDGATGAIGTLKKAGIFAKFASAIGIGVVAGNALTQQTTSSADSFDSSDTWTFLQNMKGILQDLSDRGAITSEKMRTLTETLNSMGEDTGYVTAFNTMKEALEDAGVSTDELSKSLDNTDSSLTSLVAAMGGSTASIEKTKDETQNLSQAMQETDTAALIDKMKSLQISIDQVTFADMILKSANAIDKMGGIWENGKQILGAKALAVHNEISKGLEPDQNGFYTLANGQMVQYGNAIQDQGGTLKAQTKATLDNSVIAALQEALPEQNKIGGDTGNYFIEGYTAALFGNKRIKTAYQEALANVDTASAKAKAKADGEEIARNTGEGFKTGINSVSTSVGTSVTGMMEKSVKEPAKKAVDAHSPSKWFAQLATWCGQGFGNNLNSAFSSTFSFFSNFRTKISNSIGNLYYVGYNYLIGMNNGMVAGANVLYSNARSIASNITNIFRSAWQIHSPSRVAGEIGGYFMEGMYDQMDSGASRILKMLQNFSGSIQGMSLNVPKVNIPVSMNPVSSAAYTQQYPVMAQGRTLPPKAVKEYAGDDRSTDIEYVIEKVIRSMKESDDSTDIVQSLRSAISGMAVMADGQIIGYLREKNQENLDRGGPGLFPSVM